MTQVHNRQIPQPLEKILNECLMKAKEVDSGKKEPALCFTFSVINFARLKSLLYSAQRVAETEATFEFSSDEEKGEAYKRANVSLPKVPFRGAVQKVERTLGAQGKIRHFVLTVGGWKN